MTYFDHIMPEWAQKKIRTIEIFYDGFDSCICGLAFFDKHRKLIWKIGGKKARYLTSERPYEVETVLIEENEVVVGVVAKLRQGFQSQYTDFQFQIAII